MPRLSPSLLLLLVLPACGYGSYFPVHTDVGGFDTGGGGGCGERGSIGTLTVSVDPGRPAEVLLYQLDPDTCAELYLTAIAPGGLWTSTISTGTSYVVRDPYGALVSAFDVPLGAPTWDVVIP
jgi:hypothetical protein